MAVQKQSILDQLTAAAQQPDAGAPPVLDAATASADPNGAPAQAATVPQDSTDASIDKMESLANPIANSLARKTTDQNENPSFLHRLKDMAGGAFGLEDPSSNHDAAIGAKIMNLVGGAGNGLAMAMGTPEQKEIAQQQSEMPLKIAQLRNEAAYRNALIGTKNNANDINQQKADQQKQSADAHMRMKGYMPDETSPGSYRSMSEDEIIQDPILSQNQGLQKAALASKSAESALSSARADALMNPSNPTLQLKAKQIEAQLELAKAHFAVQLHNQGRQDREFQLNYGAPVNVPSTGEGAPQSEGLTLNTAAPEQMVDPRTGNPIPYKMLATLKPTQTEQNRADFAMSAIHSADAIASLLDKAQASIGPASGRLAEYMARAGFGDKFNQELQNYVRFTQSAATAAHTGRFSVPILEKMDKMIGPQMNADQLSGAIESIKSQMSPYADAGWKPTVQEYKDAIANSAGNLKTPSGKTVSATPEKKTPTFAEFMKKAGGK